METTLKIKVECGKTTCASKPGHFCKFLGAIAFGTKPVCMLFPSDEALFTKLQDVDGWVQRCKTCLESSKNG